MAELTNVKVVNENTVEYNGFVYTLVTGDAKVGDIVKASKQDIDVTEGAFYLGVDINDDSEIAFKDDVDDLNYFNQGEHSVFRKSHAITNDKLADAEGVVKIELPDGTKLEGTPSDLEKITRSMQALQNEQQGQAEKVEAVEMPEEVVEVEDEIELVSERLQVGDYAKVVADDDDEYEKGDIVKIIEVDDSSIPYRGERLYDVRQHWLYKTDVVKATDEEVLEAKQALLKNGDFARVIANTTSHFFEIGTIVKLDEYTKETDAFTAYYIDESDEHWRIYRRDLEPLTKEDAEHIAREADEEKKAKAEREKWLAIGREVGEIKKGDIVRTTTHSGSVNPVGTIGIAEYDGTVDSTATLALNGNCGNHSRVELIVPVEQRFDKAE